MHEQTSSPLTTGRVMTPYVMGWIALGTLAAVYLAVLTVRPDIVSQYLPVSPPSSSPETNEGQRAAADTMAEVRGLKDRIGEMQLEVTRMRAEIAGRTERDKLIETRVAELETRSTAGSTVADAQSAVQGVSVVRPVLPAAAATAAAAPPVTVAATKSGTAQKPAGAPASAGAVKSGSAASQPRAPAASGSSEVKVIKPALPSPNGAPSAQPAAPADARAGGAPAPSLETGSVGEPAPVVEFGPPVVTPAASNPVGIVIASGSSIDSLRLSWSLLSDRHAETLKSLEPRYTAGADATGLTYELVAGPVKSSADAKRLCKELSAKAITCKVGTFEGEAL